MSTLIKLTGGRPAWANDPYADIADEDAVPADGGVIVSLTRLLAEADALLGSGRPVGVRLATDEAVEALEPYLPRLSLVALVFPKFRDGRHYSSAMLLRERFGFKGEVRAAGEVLREQAGFMVRCGMDAYMPSDGSTPDDWAKAASRYRHVYQTAADGQAPAFALRLKATESA